MTVWVLMTAMPVTKGHKSLIQFANQYAGAIGEVAKIVVCTQPSEPFPVHRIAAVRKIAQQMKHTTIVSLYREMEQNANAPGFWNMWVDILLGKGAKRGDTYIASEVYGKRLAEEMEGRFMPYDPQRSMTPVKANHVRKNLLYRWDDIAPEFSNFLTRTITVFGAESTGKSTLTRDLNMVFDSNYLLEYARPYLENTVNEITTQSMTDIWKGQLALQTAAKEWAPRPWTFQDTDLFSTVGYWEFPHWQETLGKVPQGLVSDALAHRSDLYLITKSNIPFERDPLRYGGAVREASDEYWINVCEEHGLNYAVLESNSREGRVQEARSHVMNSFVNHAHSLYNYERKHNG